MYIYNPIINYNTKLIILFKTQKKIDKDFALVRGKECNILFYMIT